MDGITNMFQETRLLEENMPKEQDTKCGVGFFQKFASKKSFVLIFSLIASAYSGTYSYTMGTITTLEKRYKIPSRYSGMILAGHDISMMFCSIAITYFAAKGHKPRWMAVGVYFQVLYCIMMILPHFLYGAGEDALSLTIEHEGIVTSMNETFKQESNLCEVNSE